MLHATWPFSHNGYCDFWYWTKLDLRMGQIQSGEDEEVRLADIQPLYIVFMRECPSGALHLHEFRKIFGIQSTSEDEAMFIETIFKSFDTNKVRWNRSKEFSRILEFCMLIAKWFICINSDYVHMLWAPQLRIIRVRLQDDVIDFMEFVAAVHLVLRGKLEDRLRWFFKVYDRDENGKLDKQEVKHIIKVRSGGGKSTGKLELKGQVMVLKVCWKYSVEMFQKRLTLMRI